MNKIIDIFKQLQSLHNFDRLAVGLFGVLVNALLVIDT